MRRFGIAAATTVEAGGVGMRGQLLRGQLLRGYRGRSGLVALLALSLWAPATRADDADSLLTQGEFVFVAPDNSEFGVQLVAQGADQYLGVLIPDGLPGAGGDATGKRTTQGTLAAGLDLGDFRLTQMGGSLALSQGGKPISLTRFHRRSPTEGAVPPQNAIVLFDGTSADAFEGGRVVDGTLAEGVMTKEKFGSCLLHLEFQTPFMPEARGQARGNSGCYLQGRYEVQILDSFGLAGKNNEAGGIYETADPLVNMAFPPTHWQTYDIDYRQARYDGGKKIQNARITVRHNGVIVQKNVELPKATRAHPVPEGPEPGPLYLQNHGNPVRFRHIWLLPINED